MASEMEKYEALCPGAADRIFKIAEKSLKIAGQQAEHRQKIESVAVKNAGLVNLIGVISAGVIAIVSLCLTGICVYIGHEIIGTILGGGAITSIVTAFIYGTRSNRREREAKWEKALQARNEFQ